MAFLYFIKDLLYCFLQDLLWSLFRIFCRIISSETLCLYDRALHIQWKIQPMKVKAPMAVPGLIYNGETQTGVAAGEGYTLEGEFKAVNAGEHTAVAKLTNTANYQWDDGTTEDKTIVWSIGEKTPVVSDFAVTYPRSEDLVYNGNAKEVTAKLSDSYPAQDITLTVVYTNADGIAVEEPTNAGTYTRLRQQQLRRGGAGAGRFDDRTHGPGAVLRGDEGGADLRSRQHQLYPDCQRRQGPRGLSRQR